jgi:predicted transcriptional regulator
MATKVTFNFDSATIARLNEAARRLVKPKSEIVRQAIREYHEHIGRLSESEKRRMLGLLTEIEARPPSRTQRAVNEELASIRRGRQHGGRRHRI